MKHTLILMLFFSELLFSCNRPDEILVRNIAELELAVTEAKPGSKIHLANGTWSNVELLIKANGTESQPIEIKAEEKGKVFIEGQSNLRIAGEYLVVSGLVFRNGNTPTNVVISFREKSGQYANNCRLTECVINNFNNSDRFSTESWVDMYGKNNRVDHCLFIDKRCQGVTLTVRLVDELCQNNHHQIDHNFFGYRQNLGSNGGETIRIGTSKYSLTTSATNTFANYFEHTDGEHEIISNKSCGNLFRNNTFQECRGTITFRHGNDNVAEGNFFFGNGKENTGGIRIINKRNKALNNYFSGLTGTRFRGALVVMNGIPNSPINRYHQVVGGEFSNNTFVNCDNVQLCAGSDAERTLPPVDTKIENNIFHNDKLSEIFTVYDDISGISFTNNYLSKGVKPITGVGIDIVDLQIVKNNYGLPVPVSPSLNSAGCNLDRPEATAENCGPNWYVHENPEPTFDCGKIVNVEPGLNTLVEAIENVSAGDVLVLKNGDYSNSKEMRISVPMTIRSVEKPQITSERNSMFIIENGGALKLRGIDISGDQAPDMAGNAIISSSKNSMNRNYKILVENCNVRDLTVNNSFSFFRSYKSTFADSVVIRNCSIENVSGHVIELNAENEDLGIYNAEHVVLEDSEFKHILGSVLNLYRGGTDESTFGPIFSMDRCTLTDVGKGIQNKSGSCILIHGVQQALIENSFFYESSPLTIFQTNGGPVTHVESNKFFPKVNIVSNDVDFFQKNNLVQHRVN